MTLAEAAMDAPVRVKNLFGLSGAEELRLSALGLRVGVVVTKLIRTPLRDPIECLVGSQLLALDAWLLERVTVETAQ